MRAVMLALAVAAVSADAASAPAGLFAESSTRTDDVTVRRIRDTSNGIVCYMATGYAYAVQPHGRNVAITCLKEN